MKRRSIDQPESKIASRVERALRRALLVALAAPATMLVAQACGSSSSDGGNTGAKDASIGNDASDDGGDDAGPPVDAGPCAPTTIYVDAGPVPDGSVECGIFRQFSCGLPQPVSPDAGMQPGMLTVYDDCFFSTNNCSAVCPGEAFFNCSIYGSACDAGVLLQKPTDSIIVDCVPCPNGVGRKPRGLRAPQTSRRANDNALGKYFANAAHLEAASVHAFRILRRELASFKAPRDLLIAAKRAETDEVKHARMTSRIARTHGATPPKVRLKRGSTRSLEAIATENAVEGCVRETFGALVAMWQAEHATDEDVAHAMKEIAVDEARHAALAWSVAAWANGELDATSRERVNDAKNKAIRDLEKEITVEAHPVLRARAGLPSAAVQRRLLDALSNEVFAGADFET
jgi:hypothetical protein